MWDIGGQTRIRMLWNHHAPRTRGLVFVVDSQDSQRIGDARRSLDELLEDSRSGIAECEGWEVFYTPFMMMATVNLPILHPPSRGWTVCPCWCWPTSRTWPGC